MKRELLEFYLGQRVRVQLFDKTTLFGILCQCGTEDVKHDPNLYYAGKKRYFVRQEDGRASCLFRCSHVVNMIRK